MIKKLTFILIAILLLVILTSCKSISSNQLTLKEVVSALEKEQLVIIEDKTLEDDGYFALEYNAVTPTLYALGDDRLSIYVYDSVRERENGVERFNLTTENGYFTYHLIYEVENILIFYLPSSTDEIENKTDAAIKNALIGLEGK